MSLAPFINGPVVALERPVPLLGVQRLSTPLNSIRLTMLKRVEHLSAVTFRTSLEGRSTRSVGRESLGLKRSVRSCKAWAQPASEITEPLSEIHQLKGTSETNPQLSPNDEFANYEILNYLLGGVERAPKIHGSYIREAYENGLAMQETRG